MKTLIPENILNAWLSKYPERMAIRSIRSEGEWLSVFILMTYATMV